MVVPVLRPLVQVSVIPSTGEVTYDEWEDGHMRTELEVRTLHTLYLLHRKLLTLRTDANHAYSTQRTFNTVFQVTKQKYRENA